MLYTSIEFFYMLKPSRKRIDEVLRMSERELLEYLRETDNSIQVTDSIQIMTFEHGIKALYYHKDSTKPYKTRVFLKDVESSDLLK
ncbi:Uncharacterised protein [uncultured archaeon]|nr:Uncharacterised protein [uncultured archaeon]